MIVDKYVQEPFGVKASWYSPPALTETPVKVDRIYRHDLAQNPECVSNKLDTSFRTLEDIKLTRLNA